MSKEGTMDSQETSQYGSATPLVVGETVRDGVRVLRPSPGIRVLSDRVEDFLAAVSARSDRAGAQVAVDISAVEFFGPNEMETLLQLHDRVVTAGGAFAIFGARGVVRDVLSLAGLDVLVGVFPDEVAALDHLARLRRATSH